jgi:hypothetical protein
VVSFDVVLQGFRSGVAADGDGDAALAVLAPLMSGQADSWTRIATSDGGADVHGLTDPASGLMFNHIDGRSAWDVVYDVAQAAGFAVMPVGCGTLLTDERMRDDLPGGIPKPIVVITSGADLLAAVEAS